MDKVEQKHIMIALEKRVIELTMENVALRAQLIALKPVTEVGESDDGAR